MATRTTAPPASHLKRALGIGVALAVGLIVAAPAHAGTQVSQNACNYSFDGAWRNLDVSLTGTASPATTKVGDTITLSGGQAYAALPSWIPEYGFNVGLLKAGRNEIPAQIWLALAGSNTAERTRVVQLETTAVTEIQTTPGGQFRAGSAPVVTLPLPDTTWTVGPQEAVDFSQAGPGTLPGGLPGGGGQTVNPRGSLYINAALSNAQGGRLAFVLDCQPGRYVEPEGATFLTRPPAVFERAFVSDGAPITRRPPTADVRLRPAPLTATRTALRLPLVNAGDALGRGRVTVRSAARVRIGTGKPAFRTLATASYRVAAGAQPTRVMRLTPAGRALVRSRSAVRVRVTVNPAGGRPVHRTAVLRTPGGNR